MKKLYPYDVYMEEFLKRKGIFFYRREHKYTAHICLVIPTLFNLAGLSLLIRKFDIMKYFERHTKHKKHYCFLFRTEILEGEGLNDVAKCIFVLGKYFIDINDVQKKVKSNAINIISEGRSQRIKKRWIHDGYDYFGERGGE